MQNFVTVKIHLAIYVIRTVLKFKKVLKGAKKFLLIFASLEEEIRFSLRSNLICSTRHRSQHLQPDSFSSTMKQHRESFVVLSSYQSQQKICGLLYPINKVRLHPKAASCARCAKGKNGEEEMSRHKHGEDEQ